MGFQDLSSVACIHGRFQPFHLGHVDYLKAALSQWESLVIGIAAPTPVPVSFPGVEHRNLASANPLTYLERTVLIRACCRQLGIANERIEFSPFPIDEPTALQHYVGKSLTCATTRLYAWNDEKIRRLENEGYPVVVLEGCEKMPFDGSKIRRLLADGDPSWKSMVLPAAADLLTVWGIAARIRNYEIMTSV
ncbi:adenylyltransferase/cytidyltransferase family protein [Alcaligenes aquatilis]|uniref:adenylyltransferase/cytidyltransferase family protein n=1 Tax=Alcaligenes aquatilis TaxID=323284 RepID=UPI00362146A3